MKVMAPKRGSRELMSSTYSDIILADGELFIEFSGNSRTNVRAKIGDGVTQYSELGYALGYDVSPMISNINDNPSSTVGTALEYITSGNSMNSILGAAKKAISLLDEKVTVFINNINNRITYVEDNLDSKITAGTTAFVDGQTDLATGKVYLQY